jgi:hypothetical protein
MGDQKLPTLGCPGRRAIAVLFATAALLALAALALCAARASAVILPAATIDGPSEDIVGFGGVAMAEDGTGGAVYLKRVGGVAHVFVARYVEHRWLAPVRVDREEQFAASWARIGAGEGGQLEVVWVVPLATQNGQPVDELLGATLSSGSAGFGPATVVDPNVGNGTGTSPDLAMSTTGQADVVYRVINESSSRTALLRPGDVLEEVRVARFDGERWSRLGSINRSAGISMRPPTASNAPVIAVGPTGNAVVVWQEPEITGVAHIWARRIFGANLDYVLPVSAATLAGAPVETDADAPSVGLSRLGLAVVAYRQSVGPGSPLPGPRILLNTLPDGESADGSQFAGAQIADGSVSGGAAALVGPPSVDVDEKQAVRLLYDSNGTPRIVEGNEHGLAGSLPLGPVFAGAEQAAVSVVNPAGGGVFAWPSSDAHGTPAVAVREDFPEGGVQTALLGGGGGGEVAEIGAARSGLGDALIGFREGPVGHAAIVVAHVTAPPTQFVLSVPKTWVRPRGASVSWQPAPTSDPPLRYQVVLDGRLLPTPAGVFKLSLAGAARETGSHTVQVLASDPDGEATLTPPTQLRVDGRPPLARIALRRGRTVVVRVSDSASGLDTGSVSISFGDGHFERGHAASRHTYAHAGVYRVFVHARDRAGNATSLQRNVHVA